MPYARRNAFGQIESLHQRPTPEAGELVDARSDEVRRFLGLPVDGAGEGGSYATLDAEFVRVLEDVIDLLATKGVFSVGELPLATQAKYLARKEHRDSRAGTTGTGYLSSGFVTVIDDSAFGQLADLDLSGRDRGSKS